MENILKLHVTEKWCFNACKVQEIVNFLLLYKIVKNGGPLDMGTLDNNNYRGYQLDTDNHRMGLP